MPDTPIGTTQADVLAVLRETKPYNDGWLSTPHIAGRLPVTHAVDRTGATLRRLRKAGSVESRVSENTKAEREWRLVPA
jgi:hypothetical protein